MELKVYTCILGCLLLAVGQIQAEGTIYPCPPFGIYRIQHSSSCDRYVQCFAGVAVVRPCAPGMHYSEEDQQCMSPTQAACTRDQDVCPLYNDPTNLIYHQDDVECGKYYLCYDNKLHAYTCAEGLHWDTENERCAYPEDAECGLYSIVCPPSGTANVPHPFICNRYYFCLEGKYFPQTCPADLLFDINIMNCNYPGDSECAVEVTPPVTTTSTQTPPTTTTESTTITSTTETTTSTTESTTTIEAPWFECPSDKFQVFPHPTRGCKWYVICEEGVPSEGECPLYTIYSDRLAICISGACSN